MSLVGKYIREYKIVSVLGRGTYGTVFKVYKTEHGKRLTYALKQIPLIGENDSERRKAIRESGILKDLSSSPFIIKHHQTFIEGSYLNIVMEYASGGTLHDQIEFAKATKDSFPESQVLSWLSQILLALRDVHKSHVVHRDLKPQNIFVMADGLLKLGDFGIARVLGPSRAAHTSIGTPFYLSPEQIEGQAYNERSDVWSVGCLLYEMCALTPPFYGKNVGAVVLKIATAPIPDLPPPYSVNLGVVFRQMLARDPADRLSVSSLLLSSLLQPFVQTSVDAALGGESRAHPPVPAYPDSGHVSVNVSVSSSSSLDPEEIAAMREKGFGDGKFGAGIGVETWQQKKVDDLKAVEDILSMLPKSHTESHSSSATPVRTGAESEKSTPSGQKQPQGKKKALLPASSSDVSAGGSGSGSGSGSGKFSREHPPKKGSSRDWSDSVEQRLRDIEMKEEIGRRVEQRMQEEMKRIQEVNRKHLAQKNKGKGSSSLNAQRRKGDQKRRQIDRVEKPKRSEDITSIGKGGRRGSVEDSKQHARDFKERIKNARKRGSSVAEAIRKERIGKVGGKSSSAVPKAPKSQSVMGQKKGGIIKSDNIHVNRESGPRSKPRASSSSSSSTPSTSAKSAVKSRRTASVGDKAARERVSISEFLQQKRKEKREADRREREERKQSTKDTDIQLQEGTEKDVMDTASNREVISPAQSGPRSKPRASSSSSSSTPSPSAKSAVKSRRTASVGDKAARERVSISEFLQQKRKEKREADRREREERKQSTKDTDIQLQEGTEKDVMDTASNREVISPARLQQPSVHSHNSVSISPKELAEDKLKQMQEEETRSKVSDSSIGMQKEDASPISGSLDPTPSSAVSSTSSSGGKQVRSGKSFAIQIFTPTHVESHTEAELEEIRKEKEKEEAEIRKQKEEERERKRQEYIKWKEEEREREEKEREKRRREQNEKAKTESEKKDLKIEHSTSETPKDPSSMILPSGLDEHPPRSSPRGYHPSPTATSFSTTSATKEAHKAADIAAIEGKSELQHDVISESAGGSELDPQHVALLALIESSNATPTNLGIVIADLRALLEQMCDSVVFGRIYRITRRMRREREVSLEQVKLAIHQAFEDDSCHFDDIVLRGFVCLINCEHQFAM
ncbi:hypothetical protein ADUPG1_008789 [Aduncisulcus paluster]|uniref:non-specific serine/threonine protein kinase n=1 Tax=Aduncisulcus paluster TaxID=2918883 RepID=A0ABQ5KT89_9EUKA|nr:hypothetical protein ADUPG1_008789 [Aduncisulcus paluster]